MFDRVARSIREAIEVDGVLFLDASIGSYAGLIDNSKRSIHSDQSSESGQNASETGNTDSENYEARGPSEHIAREQSCPILSSSIVSSHEEDARVPSKLHKRQRVGEKYLQRLLRKHPQGKIRNFDGDGNACSEEDSTASSVSSGK